MVIGKRLLLGLLLLVPLLGTSQPAEKVLFSVPGGFYEESPVLELYPFYQQHHIRFTTNGNRPTAQSRCYTEPLLLDGSLYSTSDIYTIQISPDHMVYVPDSVPHCIVIRAAVFDENDSCISEVATNSYFIHALGCDTHGLPVVSVCADTLDLFDYEHGILVPGIHHQLADPNWTGNYYQSGIEWERAANIEFYEPTDNSGINQMAGLRTHGGNARRGPQKGLKIYAREEYGKKRFQHRFFESIPNNSFKHLVLKPLTDEWFWSGVPNMLSQQMARDVNVEALAVRPSVLFLNGEYWGIYSVCEKPDADYLQDHFGGEEEDYNVIGDWYGTCENGTNSSFLQMTQWLENIDSLSDSNYQFIGGLADMDCFIDYYCFELFIGNDDWPANNMRCYQYQGGKWRWIFFDGDNAFWKLDFDVMENATSTLNPGWPNNLASTLMFRKLLTNPQFVMDFRERFQQLMEHEFSYDHTHPYFDSITSLVRPAIPDQVARFLRPSSPDHWETLIGNIDNFLQLRVEDMTEKLNALLSTNEHLLSSSFTCGPNPFSNTLVVTMRAETASVLPLEVVDMMGRVVVSQTVSLDTGINVLSLDLPLAPGLYVLKIGGSSAKIIRQ